MPRRVAKKADDGRSFMGRLKRMQAAVGQQKIQITASGAIS